VLACDPASVVPNIAVSFAGERVDVALDSGAPSTVVLPGRYDSILPLASKPIVTGHGRTVDAEFDILSSRLDGALDIGDIAIENPIIEFNDRAKQPHIGMRILGDYSLTIDRTNHRLMLEQPGQGSTPQSPERRLVLGGGRSGYGIRLGGLGGETLEVLGVDAGLPAAEGGLAAGDLIVAMNGRPVASLSRDERVAALRGSPLLLHIERNSHEQELRLSLDRNGD